MTAPESQRCARTMKDGRVCGFGRKAHEKGAKHPARFKVYSFGPLGESEFGWHGLYGEYCPAFVPPREEP